MSTMQTLDALIRAATDAPLGTVIHVGAGRGAVLEPYARLQPRQVVLVEGDPDTATTLQRAARPFPWARVVDRAVAAHDGELNWNRYNLPTLNGPLSADALAGSYPRLHRRDATSVPAVALSGLVRDAIAQSPTDRPNLLVLDVPGQEAALLESLGEALHGLSDLIVRRCALPLPGTAPWASVLEGLREQAFELVGHEVDGEPLWPVAHFRFDRRRHEIGVLHRQVDTLQTRIVRLEEELAQTRAGAQAAVASHAKQVEALTQAKAAAEKLAAERGAQLQQLAQNRDEQANQIAALTRAKAAAEKLAADCEASVRMFEERLRTRSGPLPSVEARGEDDDEASETGSRALQPTTIASLYETVRLKTSGAWPAFESGGATLVSVVLTTHNAAHYVEDSLESLLSQSYSNLEIIVVDDASTDETTSIVDRLARMNRKLTHVRVNERLGMNFARNVGIRKARGSILFFQGARDIAHPHRIALQVDALVQRSDVRLVQCEYGRFDPLTQELLPVDGKVTVPGAHTIGVRACVFDEIGYFDCTGEAGDDEFLERALASFGRRAMIQLDLALCLTAEPGEASAGITSDLRPHADSRALENGRVRGYVESYRRLHDAVDTGVLRRRYGFPRIRDVLPGGASESMLANPGLPVIVNVCSIPRRATHLESVLRTLAPQCDGIHVYLDAYDEVPESLVDLGVPVSVVRSQDVPGLRDNGKFLHLQELLRCGKDAYYVTVDDDIRYPPDYVNTLLKRMARYDDDVVVGVHGVTLKDHPAGYFSDRRMVHDYRRALERDVLVNVLGTGTVCFRASRLAGFDLSAFSNPGMADIYFATFCARQAIPLLCVGRHEGWLADLAPADEASLYNEFKNHDDLQSNLIMSEAPWGTLRIRRTLGTLSRRNPSLAAALTAVSPRLSISTMGADGPRTAGESLMVQLRKARERYDETLRA